MDHYIRRTLRKRFRTPGDLTPVAREKSQKKSFFLRRKAQKGLKSLVKGRTWESKVNIPSCKLEQNAISKAKKAKVTNNVGPIINKAILSTLIRMDSVHDTSANLARPQMPEKRVEESLQVSDYTVLTSTNLQPSRIDITAKTARREESEEFRAALNQIQVYLQTVLQNQQKILLAMNSKSGTTSADSSSNLERLSQSSLSTLSHPLAASSPKSAPRSSERLPKSELSEEEIHDLRQHSRTVGSFALGCLKKLFEPREVVGCNVSGTRGKNALDFRKIYLIKETVQKMYPREKVTELNLQWKACVKTINAFLRRPRKLW